MYDCVNPADWKESSVFDLAHWKNGLAFKNIDFSEAGRPVIKIAELKNGVTPQTARTMAEYDPSVFVKSGDMLFSWSGSPDTSIDVFRWEGEDGWLNQHIFKVTPSEGVSSNFLFFLLRWLKPRFVEIARNKQTTGLGHVTIQDLKQMQVAIPDSDEQAMIIEIIGPIQDKIELNRWMNKTLEAMAQEIFKDWFIDFGPTRAKTEGHAPYLAPEIWNLFPDTIDDEGKPEGWRSRTLEELAEQRKGSVSPSTQPEMVFEHFSLPAYDAGEKPAVDLGATIKSNKVPIPENAVLLSKLNPNILRVWVPDSPSNSPQIASTEFLVFVPRQGVGRSLLAALFQDQQFRQMLQAMVTGTSKSHQRVSPKDLVLMDVLKGDSPIFRAFEDIVAPMLAHSIKNRRESYTLAQTRDLLLPKLMSGEIQIQDAKESIGAFT